MRSGVDEVEGESFRFAAVSSPLDNTVNCEAYENDRRTSLHPNTRPDDTTANLESRLGKASEQITPTTSQTEEAVISADDIIIALRQYSSLVDPRP